MSLRNSSAGNVRRSRFASFRPCLQVLKPRTLLSFISWKSLGATLVCSSVLFCAIFFWPRAEASFIHALTYPAGTNPRSVAVGDFNGDGILDLAVANRGDFSGNGAGVSILLGKGDGTFQAPVISAAGPAPWSAAVADFNGDGKLDLAVANALDSGTVSILLGNRDGTFQSAQTYAVGSFPCSVAVGDFDGNGTVDLVVANGNSTTVSILLGNGDGTFQTAHSYDIGPRLPASVAVGDFNGDGHLDLAVALGNLDGMVSILLGNGDGTFQAAHRYTGGGVTSVAAGDFNGDGVLDLALASEGRGVAVLLGNGDGTFQRARYTGGSWTSVAVGDLNGDGVLDLVVASSGAATLSVLLGKGDGTFHAPHNYDYAVGPSPVSIAVGDFNSDGHLDVAAANTDGTASILLGKGDGSFSSAAASYAVGTNGIEYTRSVAVADLNGDGIADLAVLSGSGVRILLGNADGTFQTSRNYDLGFYPGSVAVADLNGDGKLDLAVTSNSNGRVSISLGNGDGTFQAPRSYTVGATPDSVVLGDFNDDGIPDLAVANRDSNTLSILLGNGDGTFQPRKDYAVGPFPLSVAVGDFNGDGRQDLVVAGGVSAYASFSMPSPSTISILLGNGDGTFQAAQIYDAGFGANSVAVGDLNGDGKLDVVTANFSALGDPRHPDAVVIESDVRVFLGNGDGTFQAPQTYAAGSSPVFLAISDFNRDGIPDLTVANGWHYVGSHAVTILLGNGDGTFQAAQNYHAGANPYCVAAGDFNGDGYPDLVVVDGYNPYPPRGTVTILINAADWGR